MVENGSGPTALIAHRGFAARFPENTLEAVRGAVALGVDGVEVDVRQCATGESVVIHDTTVERVTDGEGRVAERPLSTLRDLEVLDSDETIPTLREVFDVAPPDVTLHVELKAAGPIPEVLALADDCPNDVVVSSFDPDYLARVAERDGPPSALLFVDDPAGNLALASDLGCAFVHPHASLCLDDDLIEAAHDAGLGVNAWTLGPPETDGESVVIDPEMPDRLPERGVDGLIADAPL